MTQDNPFQRQPAPPPPMFLGEKERNIVKQINDELLERVIGQQILYYAIDLPTSNFHPLYKEAIVKNFLPPIHVHALVKWEGQTTETNKYQLDKRSKITVFFHKRRLTEDQDLFVREGDFVRYGDLYYEITQLNDPKQLWGQIYHKFETVATCVKSRRGLFDAN